MTNTGSTINVEYAEPLFAEAERTALAGFLAN
jgi:hypothetical protein